MLGLTSAEAEKRLQHYGPNQLPEKRGDGIGLIFLRQFNSPFVYMLLAAAVVSLGLSHTLNSIFISAVLVLNAVIGTIQEYSAQRAAVALRTLVPQYAAVMRDNHNQKIAATDLVPGDIVFLASGDKVPADIQLQQSQELVINESILTGESLAASKHSEDNVAEDAPLAEQSNCAFAGTIVTHGRARGEVFATGMHSQIGRIATEVTLSEHIKPPLLQRIERFTLRISYSVLVVIALLFMIAISRGDDLSTVFLLSVALAVSAIPEGLPAAITVALAIGMRRMARVNVIVRKLIAVESLGSCTYIASDKTGTLTVNEMTVKKIILADGKEYEVSGEGIDLHGSITSNNKTEHFLESAIPDSLKELILAGLLSNEATLSLTNSEDNGTWTAHGDAVDAALLVLAGKYGFDLEQAHKLYPQLYDIPYESENAYSASVNRIDGKLQLFAKGSMERILTMCDDADSAINERMTTLAKQGYRVLALATRTLREDEVGSEAPLRGLSFLGLVGMIDPLRPEAKAAVQQCHEANIQVAIITGDHPQTALAIARDLGIAEQHSAVVSGSDLAQAMRQGKQALAETVKSTHVFARIEPTQKLQIIQQLIKGGHFVAVTGDGVNDAPALRQAHVGVAMGKRGTDLAKESAELIITDDNFASVVDGIKQGRVVYNNIRKVVFLLISTGAAEITLFTLSVLFGLPIPLLPIQLLWLNLVTNGIQDVALAFEPAEGRELQQAPRPPNESIFNRLMLERVLINAVVMGCLAFGVFTWCLSQGMAENSARNLTLLMMVLFENVHVLNSRSETQSIFRQAFFNNPLLLFGMLSAQGIHIAAMNTPGFKNILQVEPVSFTQWTVLLGIALLLIIVGESHKFFLHYHHRLSTNKHTTDQQQTSN